MSKDVELCYIHKMALQENIVEEPVPFAGIIKFVEYRCPLCQTTLDYIERYTIE